MGLTELVLIAFGLAMDAFAVAVCKGLNMTKINYLHTLVIGAFFGVFQAVMPLIGWLLGSKFEKYISSVDHWVAFALLALIGVNMLRESFGKKEEEQECACADKLNFKELLMLAVATSIDALAVGITFALIPGLNIGWAVSVIGVITLILSVIGVFIGNRFGCKYKSKAEFAGGSILILIGLKILLEGLGVINF